MSCTCLTGRTTAASRGDKYDPELADLLTKASTGLQIDPVQMQDLLNKLEAIEPGMAHLLANDPKGIDAMLLQFPTFTNDPAQTRALQGEIEGLWLGDSGELTATSESIISVNRYRRDYSASNGVH